MLHAHTSIGSRRALARRVPSPVGSGTRNATLTSSHGEPRPGGVRLCERPLDRRA
jgi:hypothetical protein